MAILASSNFSTTSPYGFNAGEFRTSGDTYVTLTQNIGTGPGSRDFIRSLNQVTGTHAQPYAGWAFTGLTAAASGESRFIRIYLRIGSSFNATGNSPETVWTDKWIMIGDQGGAEPSGNRMIAVLGPRIGMTDCQLRFTKGIGGVPSEGAGDVNLTLGSWIAIQMEARAHASAGYTKIWVDNDTYASPTATSDPLALSGTNWTSTELGFFHNGTTASGGNVQLDYCKFEFADTFDSSWYANLNTGGAAGTGIPFGIGLGEF